MLVWIFVILIPSQVDLGWVSCAVFHKFAGKYPKGIGGHEGYLCSVSFLSLFLFVFKCISQVFFFSSFCLFFLIIFSSFLILHLGTYGMDSYEGAIGNCNKWRGFYKKKLKSGDCIGTTLDPKLGEITYYINGKK